MSEHTERPTFDEDLNEQNAEMKRKLYCKVCGDEAIGYNFGAIVCESCKSFYRRHVHRQPSFVCAASGTCMLNHRTRRHCPACRLEKCFAVGMRRPSHGNEHLPRSSDGARYTEGQSQYSFLMTRLLHCIKTRNINNDKSNGNQPQQTSNDQQHTVKDVELADIGVCTYTSPQLNDDDYEQLYQRISAASKCLLSLADRSIAQHEVRTASVSSSDGTVIRLAMSGYIEALQHFTELGQLSRTTMRLILREQMLEQLNLYSMFAVNGDTSGWYAVDTLGVLREQAFADFVQCLARDGDGDDDGDGKQQVHYYVELFVSLVRSFRASFEHDWPLVLLTVTLMNLLSPTHVVQYYSPVKELHRRCESFLQLYLRRNYSVQFERFFNYCTDKFPSALRHLVQAQRCLLAHLTSRSSSGINASSMSPSASPLLSDVYVSAQVGSLLEPLATCIVDSLSQFFASYPYTLTS